MIATSQIVTSTGCMGRMRLLCNLRCKFQEPLDALSVLLDHTYPPQVRFGSFYCKVSLTNINSHKTTGQTDYIILCMYEQFSAGAALGALV